MPVPYWIALFLFTLGYALALKHGEIGLGAIPVLLALGASAMLARRAVLWQKALGHSIFLVVALGLALHWLPGFHNGKVIDNVVLSRGAMPYSMSLNLDKPLIGLWILLACPWLIVLRPRGMLLSLAVLRPITLIACLGSAWILGLVAWAPNWPDVAWMWLANNLLLVSLTEELLFRGYIQGGLERLFKHEGLALGTASVLFGLAHLHLGWQWFYLATLAGLGYGLAYRHGGLLVAVWCHVFVNLVHFTLFTYPMLAPA